MVESTLTAHPVSDTATGDLVLRVCGTSHDGRIVRLRSAKCTIGSGPRCTLRLRGSGIEPMHCLILRGTAGTVIRRLSTDTRLNGKAFEDADLTVGDRLGVGTVELEVVQAKCSPEPIKARLPQPGPSQAADRPARESSAGKQVQRLSARLDLANRQGRSRVRQLVETLRAERQIFRDQRRRSDAEAAEKEKQQQQWRQELGEVEDRLKQRTDELDSLRETLEEERRRWEAERSETESQSVEQSQQFDAKTAEIDQQRSQLQQQQQQWQRDREEAENQLKQRTEELDSLRETLEEDRRQWEAERSETESQSVEQSRQLDAKTAEIDQQRSQFEEQQRQGQQEREEAENQFKQRTEELDSLRETLEEERRRWEGERAELEQRLDRQPEQFQAKADTVAARAEPGPDESEEFEAEEVAPDSPVSLENVLRQMGSSDMLHDEEHLERIMSSSPRKPASAQPADASESRLFGDSEDDEDEESIENYMTRLMRRVQSPAAPIEEKEEGSRQLPPEAAVTRKTPPIERPVKAEEPVDMSPRAAAPETGVDLSAMRELANVSARTAIARHSRGQEIVANRGKLVVALMGLVCGSLLFWFWYSWGSINLTLCAAGVSSFVALVWGIQYCITSGRLMVNKSGHLEWSSEKNGKTREKSDDSPDDDRSISGTASAEAAAGE